jgi:hypothetical protein
MAQGVVEGSGSSTKYCTLNRIGKSIFKVFSLSLTGISQKYLRCQINRPRNEGVGAKHINT